MNDVQDSGSEKPLTIDRAVRAAWKLVWLGFFVACLGIARALLSSEGFSLVGLSELGSYLQGTVASIWALAGLLFIYATFLGQREQMAQQQAELESQRKQFEIERAEQQKQIQAQQRQFDAQQESIKRQAFESAFFQLLNLHNQIVAGLRQGDDEGRDCFVRWHKSFKELRYTRPKGSLLEEVEPKTLEERWHIFYAFHESDLGHYFRNLYHVIKFVNNSRLPDAEKRRYTSLARAQLSAFELVLLFYDCLSPHGAGFKPLVEKFGMLEHLDKKLLLDAAHVQLYASSAYQ